MPASRALTFSCVLATAALGAPAQAAVDHFLGQIMTVPYATCPSGWADAHGQLVSIAQNPDLFALFGTKFGGNGTTTFALPDLRGRIVMGDGSSFGLPPTNIGDKTGEPSTILTVDNMATHNHALPATSGKPDTQSPAGATLATYAIGQKIYAAAPTATAMAPQAVTSTGGAVAIEQYQPTLVLRFCVALTGTVPKP